ncbi:hypothetical protein ACFQU3_12455 [Terrabacter sp. GCM10028922]|uniref:hypothetical protein n=1 Tax=Terrabacter sp. GCM10028922 TaxID=3273428 RepID=UPI0036232BC8
MTAYRKGADPEALTRIARSISGMQAELGRIESATRSAVGTIGGSWSGDNLLSLVDTFTTTCLPGLRACSGALDAMARRLDDNVAAQRAASGGVGPAGTGGLNDVTKTKGKKHDAIEVHHYTQEWKHTEHGEREWGLRLPLPHDGSDDPDRFANRHGQAARLLDGALGGVNWTHKDEDVRTDYEKTYHDAAGTVTDQAHADHAAYGGTLGTETKHHTEKAGISYDNGPLAGHAGASAMAGAEAKADTSLAVGKDGLKAQAGANAFAGAKAAAEVGASIAGIGGTVGGEVYAGIGAHANVDAAFSAERVKVNVDVGAAVGVGAGVKFGVDVQPKEFVDDVGHGLGGAGSAVEDGFRHGAESVGRVFGW